VICGFVAARGVRQTGENAAPASAFWLISARRQRCIGARIMMTGE
jgi:hypothetical protein